MGIPGQRRSGQFGGDGHRSNKRAFRASGGNVKPPKKGCLVVMIAALAVPLVIAGLLVTGVRIM